MANIGRSILSTLIYYDLLDRPLTDLEIYKYLLGPSREVEPRRRESAALLYSVAGRNPAPSRSAGLVRWVSFFDFKQTLAELVRTKKIEAEQGLYFLADRSDLIKIREKRLKLAQLKWKKLKKLARWLALVPFLRLAAVTGSLTAYNTRQESDFDLLIVAKNDRLWLTRTLITGLCSLLRARRHDQFTQDRICLNCYLTEDSLEIKPQAKPRDFHSAQEYGRLTPILEIEKGLYQKFLQKNFWLHEYLNFYPWPSAQTAKKIKSSRILSLIRKTAEWLLGGTIGDRLEKTLNSWQIKRINQKIQTEPLASRLVSESERALRDRRSGADQIYISNQCLMFHPHSKSYQLMQNWQAKIKTLTN